MKSKSWLRVGVLGWGLSVFGMVGCGDDNTSLIGDDDTSPPGSACPEQLVTTDGHVHYYCHPNYANVQRVKLEPVAGEDGVVALPDRGTTAVFRGLNPEAPANAQVMDLSSGLTAVTGNPEVHGVSVREALGVESAADIQVVEVRSGALGSPIHLKVDLPDNRVDITLESGTRIYSRGDWDGIFTPADDVTDAVNAAGHLPVSDAILAGNSQGPLVFDRPVKAVLESKHGALFYSEDPLAADWFEVPPCHGATETSPGSLRFPDGCAHFNEAAELLVGWTFHLTIVAAKAGDACDSTLVQDTPPKTVAAAKPLTVNSCMTVPSKQDPYIYQYVNIVDGGELRFIDDGGTIDFRASAILIEQGGTLSAGSAGAPFGANGGHLDVGLWGRDPTDEGKNPPSTPGIACKTNSGKCYPDGTVGKICKGSLLTNPCVTPPKVPPASGGTPGEDRAQYNAYFEGYKNLPFDESYFGFKALAVSYGGSLKLFGHKGVGDGGTGAVLDASPGVCDAPSAAEHNSVTAWAELSGESWGRVEGATTKSTLTVDRAVSWEPGDRIVVGTNDWHVSHSEVATVASNNAGALTLVTDSKDPDGAPIPYQEGTGLAHDHSGEIFRAKDVANDAGNDQIEARAVVGLLTRSIRIRSLGETFNDEALPDAASCQLKGGALPDGSCFFGGHVMARQGFAHFQVSGVEFYQLGQGGRMGHYPVHFHLLKDTSYTDAFIRDSSIWDSMTRFVTVHATHQVEVARNVGYLSVGHAYYLEDGSEINNLFCHNLGVHARPSITTYFDAQPSESRTARAIPGILPSLADGSLQGSDTVYPTMFWMMNGYNDFVGNAAVGVGGFGLCYWILSSGVSGPSRDMLWARKKGVDGIAQSYAEHDYANFNQMGARQAPLKQFVGNTCQTAPYAFMTERLSLVPNLASGIPSVTSRYTMAADKFPIAGSNFNPYKHALYPDADPVCLFGAPNEMLLDKNATYCVTTILDRLSTRYNWPEVNFASIWLRPWNWVVSNGAVADQLTGGLGFVSGGSWEQVLPGYLTVSQDGLYYGTLPAPLNGPDGDAHKGPDVTQAACGSNFCEFHEDGTALYLQGFNPKRLLSIYDGPFNAAGNTFGRVFRWTCEIGATHQDTLKNCGVYGASMQPLQPAHTPPNDQNTWDGDKMLVVDASIGWKQPNGFYYPPAFSFLNTAFEGPTELGGVEYPTERHNVLDPAYGYWQGTAINDHPPRLLLKGSSSELIAPNGGSSFSGTFPGITPIDFTTILNDLDGSLNGVVPTGNGVPKRTAGMSNNAFYMTPGQDAQCHSFGTNTVPHDFVTTVMARLLGDPKSDTGVDVGWVGTAQYPMVPVYRQYIAKAGTSEQANQNEACDGASAQTTGSICSGTDWGCRRGSFMIGAQNGQAPALMVNNGKFYIDTTLEAQAFSAATNLPTSNAAATECVFGEKLARNWFIPPFDPGDHYVLYNLFSNSNTHVTYQVYVGEGVTLDDIQWVRVQPHLSDGDNARAMRVSPWTKNTPTDVKFINGGKVLEYTMDTSSIADEYQFQKSSTSCQPLDICQVNDATPAPNGCTVSDAYAGTPLEPTLKKICETFVTFREAESNEGVYLGDCPPGGGCPGLAFKMGTKATGDDYVSVGLPLAEPYPTTAPWDRELKSVSPQCAGNVSP